MVAAFSTEPQLFVNWDRDASWPTADIEVKMGLQDSRALHYPAEGAPAAAGATAAAAGGAAAATTAGGRRTAAMQFIGMPSIETTCALP